MYKLYDSRGLIKTAKEYIDLCKEQKYYPGSTIALYMLSDWLCLHDCQCENIKLEDCEIVFESKYDDAETERILKALTFKQNYVYSFILLKNNKAVGLNENPSIGYTFPVIGNVSKKIS